MIAIVGALFATALLSGHLAIYLATRSKGSKTVFATAGLMATTAWWAFWNAFEYLAPSLALKMVFANLQYLAIASIGVMWFSVGYCLDQDERGVAVRYPHVLAWVIPVVTAALVWTDPMLGLVRHSFRLGAQAGIPVIAKEWGPWFWVLSLYSYVFIIAGTVLILRGVHAGRGMRRAQRLALFAGGLLPIVGNLLYLSSLLPLGSIDPTPLAFSVTGLLLVLNLSRFRFLALVTAAQVTAVEKLMDAVVIVDREGILAYANSAARSSFGVGPGDLGRRLSGLGAPFSTLPADEEAVELSHGERRYETRCRKIMRGAKHIGSVIMLFDVTRRAAAEESLQKANLRLEERIAERTKALEETNERLTGELEQRRRAEKQLSHDVLHDPLTGLANRSLALSRIEQFMARSRRDPSLSFGVLCLELDGFKSINDNFGHTAGDSFLCEVASRLKRGVREVDLVARVGGDEFVILLDGLGSAPNFEEVAERVADTLCVPVSLGQDTVVPSASIGILTCNPTYREPEQVLHDADIAMSHAKRAGRSQRVVFSEDMRQKAHERSLLSGALRTAIASGGISLAFQPIVRMDGSLVGWEVLARWRHPDWGAVSPDRFIPLAEETGLIIPLGTFVLIETLKTAASLRDAGLLQDGSHGVPYFSVNVSAIQIGQGGFADLVIATVDRTGLPRSVLHLELTESAIMENRDSVTHVIEDLSAAGISVNLDDFGTGYSSLGYLHRIPIDCVKIDRSFVARMDSDPAAREQATGVVRGMISLSHELRKTVVAEGIETAEQARMLASYGCDFGQGYLFGKPMDRAALVASLGKKPAVPDQQP